MFRALTISGLALLISAVATIYASADTITDPIVRTRTGGGSIPIPPNSPFNWGTFPVEPPGFEADCTTGTESLMSVVTCEFVNQTGQALNFLGFAFDYRDTETGLPPVGPFLAQDGTPQIEGPPPDSIGWTTKGINQLGAQFIGNGIQPEICDIDCVGGHFFVDLIGFPDGTHVTMTAAAEPVPEPMTLTLLATGLALGAGVRRRRNKG